MLSSIKSYQNRVHEQCDIVDGENLVMETRSQMTGDHVTRRKVAPNNHYDYICVLLNATNNRDLWRNGSAFDSRSKGCLFKS